MMDTPNSDRRRAFFPGPWAGLAAALGVGLASFFLSTRHGMGLGNDSWAFTLPALAQLRGESVVSLHHPPLLGWLIWAVSAASGSDVVDAARVIQLVATVALITGVHWQLRWALPQRPHAAAAAALLTALCFPIVEHEGNVGSDLLGAAFAVWALGLLARHLAAAAGWRWLGACVVVAALALLNRFAAFGLVFSISVVLWLHRGRPLGRDFAIALGAGFVMVAPCALFLAGNMAVTGHATTRQIVWNGIPWDRIRQSLGELSLWYLPNRLAGWPAALGLVLAAAVALWLSRERWRAAPATRALLATLAGFGLANLVFLVAAISLVEYGLALDSRMLLPCVPVSLAFGVLAADLFSMTSRLRCAAGLVILFFLVGLGAHRAGSLVASYHVLGRGHLNVTTQQSRLPDFVHAHPEATFVTNNPPYFFNLTRIVGVAVPAEYSILTNLRDPGFDAEVAALRARLRGRAPVFFVVFDTTDVETRVPASRLLAGDRFARVLNDYFVAVYRFVPPHTADAK